MNLCGTYVLVNKHPLFCVNTSAPIMVGSYLAKTVELVSS